MRLYLVRHGRTAWNDIGRAQGQTDIPLDEVGMEQARLVAESFVDVTAARVLTSDLQRSRQTAEAIAKVLDVPLEVRPALRERTFGDLEGQNYVHVMERLSKEALRQGVSSTEVRPPNGESHADVWKRVRPVVEELFASDEDAVLVAHGGSLSALAAQLGQGTFATMRFFSFANTSVTELRRQPDGLFRLVRYNDTAHLDPLRARAAHAVPH